MQAECKQPLQWNIKEPKRESSNQFCDNLKETFPYQ